MNGDMDMEIDPRSVAVGLDVYAGDQSQGLESLPREIVEMILGLAGPIATARAATTSHYMAQTARHLAQLERRRTAEELCPDYLTCLQEFMLAAAYDDADTVEYIITSGVIDPRQPLTGGDVRLPRAPGYNQTDAYSLLRTRPPTNEGWTPLTVAAAYGSPAVLALLASIGVRPRTTVEALINGLIDRARDLKSWQSLVSGIDALTRTYPRSVPLAPADENPLAALRTQAAFRAARAFSQSGGRALPADIAHSVFESDVRPIIESLMRAGYSAKEHARQGSDSEARSAANALRHNVAMLDQRRQSMHWVIGGVREAEAHMIDKFVRAYAQQGAER